MKLHTLTDLESIDVYEKFPLSRHIISMCNLFMHLSHINRLSKRQEQQYSVFLISHCQAEDLCFLMKLGKLTDLESNDMYAKFQLSRPIRSMCNLFMHLSYINALTKQQ